jgi:hypothetical protein
MRPGNMAGADGPTVTRKTRAGAFAPWTADERRRRTDRRVQLERAASLASQAIELRGLVDIEASALTAIAGHIELLRTPTAPDVQRQVASQNIEELLDRIVQANDRVQQTLERFIEAVREDRTDHEAPPSNTP